MMVQQRVGDHYKTTCGEMKDIVQGLESTSDSEPSMLSLREVIDTFHLSRNASHEDSSQRNDVLPTEKGSDLEQQMIQYVCESPGKSCNALFKYFRERGFSHKCILETYNILLYDRKVIQRLNVGTDRSPRYAHFLTDFFAYAPGKDVLYDVLGPVSSDSY
jgi:hypothetical protein